MCPVRVALAVASASFVVLAALSGTAGAETLAPNFADKQVVAGVNQATIARFAPDGEVFVAEQNGIVEVFANVVSTTPTQVVNLGAGGTEEVFNEDDRGLLGMAVDPSYPARPYLYLLFAYNAPPGQLAPFWKPGENPLKPPEILACPTPPGPNTDGCTISGRLVRITIDQTTHTMVPGSELPVIKDEWCQQFTSHSVGDLQFGPEGALYVSAGTGALWNTADYGELGGTLPNAQKPVTPQNPCGDPIESSPGAGHIGLNENAPSAEHPTEAEGGQLRGQSFRRPESQPATLDGTIARVDPGTGAPLPDNPNISKPDIDRQRTVAYGLRQPFRYVFRPGTSELWIADVGENTWEEIDQEENPLASQSPDFGWPCFEGNELEPDLLYGKFYFESDLCKGLIKGGEAVPPVYAYKHTESVVAGDGCPTKPEEVGSAITAIGFQYGGPYPALYEHALFFGDYARNCMWAMLQDPKTGLPDPKHIQLVFKAEHSELNPGAPVDLEVGPDKNLYYVNRDTGELRRLSDTEYPTAVAMADRPTGIGPLTVSFNAKESIAATTISSYHWDYGDGGTSSEVAPAPHAYTNPGTYTATLTVTDKNNNSDTTSMLITVDRPLHAIATADKTEGVGSLAVNFSGHESTTPDSIARYHWDFGDGTSAETVDAAHVYTSPGSYTATLIVIDPGDVPGTETTSSAVVHITVAPSPLVTNTLTSPPPPTTTITSEHPILSPEVTGLSLDSARLAPGASSTLRKSVRHRGYTTGATLRFTSSQAVSVTLSFAKQIGKGRAARWVSVAAGVVSVCRGVNTARGRRRHLHTVCSRPSSDHLAFSAQAGANTYIFSGWVGGVALPPGSYRMTLRAATAAAATTAGPVSFAVVAPSRGSHH